jgi:hypothetical protein
VTSSQTSTYSFNVHEFERLYETGILDDEKNRAELLDGTPMVMEPVGESDRGVVDWLTEVFVAQSAGRYRVGVQNALRLDDRSEPLPDIVLYAPERFGHHPRPVDTFLVVEVADSTIDYDLGPKLEAYAGSGIEEVW